MSAELDKQLRAIQQQAAEVLSGLDIGEASTGFQKEVRIMPPPPLTGAQRRARELARSLQTVINDIETYLHAST